MNAPIYPTCAADTTCQVLLGDGEGNLRLWPFGQAPIDPPPQLPYATYQNVGGAPQNNLSSRPDADQFSLQVNVWGATSSEVRAVSEAIRDAIELESHIVRWGSQVQDAETKAFGYDFDVDWFTHR